ncbi:MAG: hypothetical protein ACLSWY_02590 [Ruthenibacterium lactatiformans]
MNSITKRWVRGSLLVTILMCLVAEAVFLYYSITNYYDGARRAMTTRTSTIITQLNASAAQTGESQGVLLRRMVEQFTEKDKFELMLVNAAGKPLVTSTGFAPDDSVAGEDYLEALASEKGEGHAVYRTAMGEKVMAVTTLLPGPRERSWPCALSPASRWWTRASRRWWLSAWRWSRQWCCSACGRACSSSAASCAPSERSRLPPRRSPREIWTRVSKTNIMMRSASCPTPSTIWRASWTRPSA